MCADERAAEKHGYWGDFASAERRYILAATHARSKSRVVQARISKNLSKVRQHILDDIIHAVRTDSEDCLEIAVKYSVSNMIAFTENLPGALQTSAFRAYLLARIFLNHNSMTLEGCEMMLKALNLFEQWEVPDPTMIAHCSEVIRMIRLM